MIQKEIEYGSLRWLLEDPIYATCLRMTIREGGRKRQGYGALLINNNTILSAARNIKVRAGEPWPLMGYANHAEGMAIYTAELFGRKVKSSQLYVAGVLENGILFVHDSDNPRFTCGRCASLIEKYGIEGINIPTNTGWFFLDRTQVKNTSAQFKQENVSNGTGRKMETVYVDPVLTDEIKKRILMSTPTQTVDDLRQMGIRVSDKTIKILATTKDGYPPEEIYKQRLLSLI